MFFSGSLQEGIALAVNEAKAIVCFVRDDGDTSSTWEDEYFKDEQVARLLGTKAIVLRLMKDSQEAGFLTSFCPVTMFPAVVVIKNGMLGEYIVPEISRETFYERLRAVLDVKDNSGENRATSTQDLDLNQSTATAPAPAPAPAAPAQPATSAPVPPQPQPQLPSEQPRNEPIPADVPRTEKAAAPTQTKASASAPKPKPQFSQAPKQVVEQKPRESKQQAKPKQETIPKINIKKKNPTVESVSEPADKPQTQIPTPPKQYRLQVRLFDGTSVRSSFSPSQTIRGDVRPWVESHRTDERRPYNLKHILTPLPNRTLTIAEEEQTLEELGLGSSATLVMVPINTYIEAYSAAGSSLPVRAASTIYNCASSILGTATGLVGSLVGYGPTASTPSPPVTTPNPSSPGANAPRPRPTGFRGPIIRTLRDQREEQDDRQLYNGNQLNFQPRRDTDSQ
ncbi:hypothetical protein FE257_008688 [Aspergillus nanangensis]|uniref:UBX domain-containing protein 2 n=1 Tax=Aspergillus nanangensis TaxID=2582783 RepID=A0AAD4CKV7_ASPNN|nr:hypothetical protein FE257_008688 [Aspergillus nanangensis]